MDEKLWMSLLRTKPFRRRRKHDGKDLDSLFSNQTHQEETRDKGLLCRGCHKRILWKYLNTAYEKQGTDWIRLWICSECGKVLREDNISAMIGVFDL